MTTAIATWFVADTKDDASRFAQVAGNSAAPEFQLVYWRCVAVFFATSKIHNPTAKHVFFTNTQLPVVDGTDFGELFSKLRVQVITLPITFRLPKDVSDSWGNQFYILDVIRYLAEHRLADSYIVLDCDCVWTAAADPIVAMIADKSCLLYTLGHEAYPLRQKINGVTRQEMALLEAEVFGDTTFNKELGIHYHGGEIFAATHEACADINQDIDRLWAQRQIAQTGASGYLEEAHFLSIIYKHRKYEPYTANFFIKRIWTMLRYNTVLKEDMSLPIWHLPAEKVSGFRRAYRLIVEDARTQDPAALNTMLKRIMGIPRRSVGNYISDLASTLKNKLLQRARNARAARARRNPQRVWRQGLR